MTTQIYKVAAQGQPATIERQDGSTLQKCDITLQEFGERGEYGKVAATLIGPHALRRWQPGDTVAARLRYTTHDYEGRAYQDITVTDIIKLNQ